jgi:hypothetical protein
MSLEAHRVQAHRLAIRQRTDACMVEDEKPEFSAQLIPMFRVPPCRFGITFLS